MWKKTKKTIPYIVSIILVIAGILSLLYSINCLNIKNRLENINSKNTGSVTDFDKNKNMLNEYNDEESSKKNRHKSDNLSDFIQLGESEKKEKKRGIHISKELYNKMLEYNNNLVGTQIKRIKSPKSFTGAFIDLTKYGLPNNCVGTIKIPSIGLSLPIYLGASDSNMALGSAHLNNTSAPIGGKNTNCVICGHTGYVGMTFFDNLPNVKKGDKVIIENFWDSLKYKVVETAIVKNDDSSILYIEKDKDIVTLFTCISDGEGGFNRYVVIAERI